jgi:hypothetical protein
MALSKNFVIRNGLEVSNDLIYADASLDHVGIGTTTPLYHLDTIGDIALTNRLLVGVNSSPTVKITTGIASAASPGVISGINTSSIRINDTLTESLNTYFSPGTRIVSIGASILNLNVAHLNGIGSTTLNITVSRRVTSGDKDNILVSNGANIGPEWKRIDEFIAIGVTQSNDNINYNVIFTGNPGDIETKLRVDNNGLIYNPSLNRLGIGTSAPSVSLDVVGNTKVSGIVTTNTLLVTTASTLASANATSLTVTPGDTNLEDVFAEDIEATSFRIGSPPSLTDFQIDNYNFYRQSSSFSATVGVAVTVDSYNISASNFKVAEYTFFIQNGANIQAQKVLLMQNGTTAFTEEYAIMYNPNIIVSIGSTISGSTCSLLATPVTGTVGIVTYMFTRNSLR